jgi:hypothetical protein
MTEQALPEVDEYSGMSVVDIAHAVINWPPGSDDQQRAIAAIQARRPGIGHNKPPLGEELVEEVAPLAARQTAMLEVARRAAVVDDESAAKVNDLKIQLKALEDEIKRARDERLRPYLLGCDLINKQYNPLIAGLAAAYGNRMTGLSGLLNIYIQKRDAAAEDERRRLAAEARQREEEAEAARRAAEAARAAGKGAVGAELGALKAEEVATLAQERALAARPAPIRSTLGQVSSVRGIAFEIENLRTLLGWAIKQTGMVRVIEIEARKWVGAYLRQLGVDAVERGVEIPGVRAWIERSAGSRR